jgi:dTDP-4-amino-4,6-dideoxygalactose transaminase
MSQRQLPFGKPLIYGEERAAIEEVLASGIMVHGPKVKQFEKDFEDFTKAPHALAVASCTAGLHLSYFYNDIKPGDEVICPAQTHTATAHAIEYCGGKPVFIDAEEKTGNIDISQIEAAITENTRAITLVHYLGLPVDMDAINKIAKKHDLFVVEDCALSIGAYYKGQHTGLLGDVGAFSFYPVKHMTTAEGGMLITKHEDMAKKIGVQRAFGVDKVVGERKEAGIYDVTMLGFNYRMNEIESAMGVEQLKRMPGFLEQRKKNFDTLYQELQELSEVQLLESSNNDCQSSYYCLSFLLKDRFSLKRPEVQANLKAQGVGTSVYYPKAVPLLTYYREKYGFGENEFPIASKISDTSIALPVGPHLDEDDMRYVANAVKESIRSVA